jgi:starch phosphorylase
LAQNTQQNPKIAYFSMEVGLRSDLPTYSGGLGVLAGDTLKSAADMGLPVVGVSLLHRKGYFKQDLDNLGRQVESPVSWNIENFLKPAADQLSIQIEGKTVKLRAWVYPVVGVNGHVVPVYFLDSCVDGNSGEHRELTEFLYGGNERYRLCQEAVLGLGGIQLLAKLGYVGAEQNQNMTYHMNEGHASLLTVGLLRHWGGQNFDGAMTKAGEAVAKACVFTTHTPVEAGHDRFELKLVEEVLGQDYSQFFQRTEVCDGTKLNMSLLAMRFSRYVNGVAKRHGEVSRKMFPGRKIAAITNGVHAASWTAPSFDSLFDEFLPGWRQDNHYLRYACEIPTDRLWQAHQEAKALLFERVSVLNGHDFSVDAFTVGFARRAAEYKRGDLLFDDPEALKALAKKYGKLQLVFAGKAHPRDFGGKKIIERINEIGKQLKNSEISFVYMPNYDMALGRLICAGVDVWLNNPIKPLEASGTSGMKAALNGVPSLSTLDGWWVEACIEGVTGWEIADQQDGMAAPSTAAPERRMTAQHLYTQLDKVMHVFHKEPQRYREIMRNSIFLNASFFNTQRMMEEYAINAYQLNSKH